MKNKIVSIVLSIILMVVPILVPLNITYNYNIFKIIALLICGAILLIITLLRFKELKFDAVDKLIFVFGILAILSTIFSVNVNNSIIGESNRYEGLLSIVTYILIYYNAKYFFIRFKHFENIAIFIYLSICALAIVQFYVSPYIKLNRIFGSGAVGTFGNTNFIGSFISIILPAFILKYIFTANKKYLLGSLLSFYVLIICVARSSWVAFAISFLIVVAYLIITKKKELWKRFFVLLTLFVICFGIINITQGKQNKVSNKIKVATNEIISITKSGITQKMGSSRIEIWRLTLKVICKFPILGCGIDSLRYGLINTSPLEYIKYIKSYNSYIDKAHNEYLQIAATIGLPALFIYLGFLTLIVVPKMKESLKNEKAIILFTIIISYLAQAFFNVSTIGVAPIFWFVLGIASKHVYCKKNVAKKRNNHL